MRRRKLIPQWSHEEIELLRHIWDKKSKKEIQEYFPHRSWRSIQAKAYRIRDYYPKTTKAWTPEERQIVYANWGRMDKLAIQKRFLPHRTTASIEGQARRLGLTQERIPKRSRNIIIRQLINERQLLGWTRKEVAKRSGYTECQIAEWERGNNMSMLPRLQDWAESLGYKLVLLPKED